MKLETSQCIEAKKERRKETPVRKKEKGKKENKNKNTEHE